MCFATVLVTRREDNSVTAKLRPELANPQGSLQNSVHGTKTYLLFILQSAQPYT